MADTRRNLNLELTTLAWLFWQGAMIVAVCEDAGVKHVVTVGFEYCDVDIPEALPVPQLRAKTAIEETIKVCKFVFYGAGQTACSMAEHSSLQEPPCLDPLQRHCMSTCLQLFLIHLRNPALPIRS